MRRRDFISLLGGAAVALPLAARAQQQPGPMRRIGIVMPFAKGDAENEALVAAFKQELAKLGWADGRNVQFDERWTTDNMDVVRAEAASLMASNPDVVIATGGRVVPILMQLSNTIPIVLPGGSDPVRMGYAKTLARPGGNVTGFATLELSMLGKSIEILKQIAPAMARAEEASGRIGIEPIAFPIHGFSDIDRAVASLAVNPNSGIYFLPDVSTLALRNEVVDLTARHRLPAIYWDASFVKLGGLAFYGIDRIDLFRRSAGYVDRILRGEKAADLPFQQPTQFRLVINLKTAKALGLTIPQTLLATADEVIE